jgi:tetratricopeptide (TPR) repeat protein
MLLTEHQPASTAKSSPFVTTDSPSPASFSGANRQTYFRLRMALGIRLRRQVFFAVCDDLALRSQLTQWLVSDLSRDPLPEMDTIANEPAFNQTQLQTRSPGIRLVTLTLHPDQPDLQKQIAEWLAHRRGRVDRSKIAFQIVGIDSITRQSATVQRQFINSLRALVRHYAQWDLNLVLWVTKPWFHSIRQSAPEFWRCYTGIFDFTAQAFHSEIHSEDDRLSSNPVAPLAETVRLNDLTEAFTAEWLAGSLSVSSDLALTETVHNLALLHQESADDATLAMAYRALGNCYRDQTSPTEATFSLGIRAYQEALQHESQRSHSTNNPIVADLLNDLGNLYWMRSRQQPDSNQQCQDLETAVDHYQKAVAHTDEIQEPQRYIMLQNNLGSIWGELAQNADAETYLPHSIAAYELSLNIQHVQTAYEDGQRRANTENNLGTAYWTLAQYQKPQASSLQKAIAHYSNALEFYDVENYSMPHAMIQNNLGTAFWNLSQCEILGHYSLENSHDLLIHAITAYKVALLYRTPEALPLGYAATQNNLGTAYWNLATDRLTHSDEIGDIIELTIVSYQASLTMVEALIASGSVNFSFDPFATHYNLATAFNSSVKYVTTDHHNVLQKAFTHHLIAWQGWQNQPDQATAAINGLVQVLRTANDRLGRDVQSKLLSSLPPPLLTVVMPKV